MLIRHVRNTEVKIVRRIKMIVFKRWETRARFGGTYTNAGTMQRRSAWPCARRTRKVRERSTFLFTVVLKQPKCPSVNEWIDKLWCIYTMEFYAAEKEGAPALCDSMDGTGKHFAK